MVGSSRIQRFQYGITVLTCVCWSMISETQMAYGSRVRRHGRSRAFCANQPSNAGTSRRSFEFCIFGFELERTTIWWGEATDEPCFGQRFLATVCEDHREVGVQACYLQTQLHWSKLKPCRCSRVLTQRRKDAEAQRLKPTLSSEKTRHHSVTRCGGNPIR